MNDTVKPLRKWVISTVVLFLYSVVVTVFSVVQASHVREVQHVNEKQSSQLTKLTEENESLQWFRDMFWAEMRKAYRP